ncbi:cation diffusion facilitator family transporter [Clostridium sp. NSJ-145]|uniref:cation diffusion facilitator family transporter n=1 Tax=Clostridium sp. NSJ-145 TaxID=2897777 RepID=UPI001E2C33B0|nr:cation diffusion facilitator family transporter [Clostridium sp. NSJ-145]MCD2502929.1 cation diffusion facilitator family transporter [Clostridium sp. NSJ-145]
MITNYLIKTFVKDNEKVDNIKVRNAYGNLAGAVGILVNVLLFAIKLSVGLLAGSVAVMADAFNNLSDAASSIITIIGFKMANKPADAEHPFGHGRIEYISALIVSFLVMLVGLQFIKSSFERITNPSIVKFEVIPFLLLLVSIFFKLWLSKFNKTVGHKINSSALKAAATDALGDVFTSSTVVISFLLAKFTQFPLDGYIGVFVACAIIYSGYGLIKETLNPLLGEAPDPVLVNNISDMVMSYENINGIHDLVVHNYGPGRIMASIHAEIPSDIDVMTIHHIIDTAEREISKKLNIYLVIHMDPICVDTDEIIDARKIVEDVLKTYPAVKSLHDFRVVGENDIKNLIFDIVVNPTDLNDCFTKEKLSQFIERDIKKLHPQFNCIITVDLELI